MRPDEMLKEVLFEAARHLSTPEERRAYLDRACADDPKMRREIEALLELEAPADEFFHACNSTEHGHREASQNHGPHPDEASDQSRFAD